MMKHCLTYSIHSSRVDKAKKIGEEKNGIYHSAKPEKSSPENFVVQQVEFDSLSDMNHFIYSSYNLFGLYFFIIRAFER